MHKQQDELWSPGCKVSKLLTNGESKVRLEDLIQLSEFQGLPPAKWVKMATTEDAPCSSTNENHPAFIVSDVRYYKRLKAMLSQSIQTLVLNSNPEMGGSNEYAYAEPDSHQRPDPALQKVDELVEPGDVVESKRAVLYPWLLYVAGCHLYNHYIGTKPAESRKPDHLVAACGLFFKSRSECGRLSQIPALQTQSIVRELEQLWKNVDEKHRRARMLASTLLPDHQTAEWEISKIRVCVEHFRKHSDQGGLLMADLALYFAETFWQELHQLSGAETLVYLHVLGGPCSPAARSLHAYLMGRTVGR